jgi:hypothetical protein
MIPGCYMFGQEINWEAESKIVTLKVELPFWLFCNDGSLKLNYKGREWDIEIRSDFAEFYYGLSVADSKQNCFYIGQLLDNYNDKVESLINTRNFSIRKCKSCLVFKSPINGWIYEKIEKEEINNFIDSYLVAWCSGHIELVDN